VPVAGGTPRRRRGLLVAGAAVAVLAAGATGYAVGTTTAGSSGHDQVTRQGPPSDPEGLGDGFGDRHDDGRDDDGDGSHDGPGDGFAPDQGEGSG